MWNMSKRDNGRLCFALKPVALDLPILVMQWQAEPADRRSGLCHKHKVYFSHRDGKLDRSVVIRGFVAICHLKGRAVGEYGSTGR
jgi:hypothetical protein